jgi:hypothetical protein
MVLEPGAREEQVYPLVQIVSWDKYYSATLIVVGHTRTQGGQNIRSPWPKPPGFRALAFWPD